MNDFEIVLANETKNLPKTIAKQPIWNFGNAHEQERCVEVHDTRCVWLIEHHEQGLSNLGFVSQELYVRKARARERVEPPQTRFGERWLRLRTM